MREIATGGAALFVLVFVFAALGPSPAAAEEPADLAVRAQEVHTKWCPETAGRVYTQAAEAVAQVTPVWLDVSRAFDASGEEYLRYWRAMLGLCIGQGERAADDLREFIVSLDGDPQWQTMVDEARRRLRRLGVRAPPKRKNAAAAVAASRAPRIQLALSGGYRRLGDFDYGAVGLDLAGRIVGPLHIQAGFRASIGDLWRGLDGEPIDPPTRAFLPAGRVGAVLQWVLAVEPRVGLSLAIAGNGDGSVGAPVLVGPLLHGGLDIPLPKTPVAVRVDGEVGYLHPMPAAGVSGGLALRF